MGDNKLKKNITLIPALALVVGTVIGSGVFFKPKAVFTATGAPGLGMVAWILGGIITIAAGLTAAELAAAIPKTGGAVTYLKETYGDLWGFLFGWAQTCIYFPGTIAALGIIFGTQAAALLGLSSKTVTPIAIGIVLFLTLFNILGGSKASASLQTIATACKLIPLFLIIAAGFMKGDGGTANFLPMVSSEQSVATGLGSALIACMFAYNGWINVGAIAGEMKNPSKDLPKAIVGGLVIVMAIYVSINAAYLYVLPASKLAVSATPAADVAIKIFGVMGGKIIISGILISIFGTLNGYIFTVPRVPYSLALENKLPASKWLSKLHPKTSSPINTTLLIVSMAIIYIFTGSFDQLTNLAIFVMWLFYVLTFFGVYVLRKKQPKLYRPYKVPLYPIVPMIAILGGSYIIVNTLITQPKNSLLGILITLIGIPVYLARRSKFKLGEEIYKKAA